MVICVALVNLKVLQLFMDGVSNIAVGKKIFKSAGYET